MKDKVPPIGAFQIEEGKIQQKAVKVIEKK
jgi:hypothetical protein